MKISKCLSLGVFCLFLPSCSMMSKWVKSYSPKPFYKGNIAGGKTDFYRSDGTVNANGEAFKNLLENAKRDKDSRNELIGRCLLASERIGSEHIAKIPGIQSAGNVGLGTGANLASGLATVFTPASTKTALAATSSLFGASRELVNNEVYHNTLAPVIVKKIQDKRTSLRSAIILNLKKPVADYPVFQALSDVAVYHEAASFYSGISQVVTDAARKDSFTEKLDKLQRLEAAGLEEDKVKAQMDALAAKVVNGE